MDINKHVQYTLKEQKELTDINSMGYVLEHKKTGASIVLIENDDSNKTFSIGFRTPPKDDTGVAHITEHSVLCGSKKFPVKDPFMELVKGSLNTFLNAMTYPDKTVYPVASTNDKDFKNLVDIYMDAVFHPNIYVKPEIFWQEGFTMSLESPEAELIYNGVVYNEMKGAFSSADDVLDRVITQSLFPDTCYGVESGGNPDNIPELTYEKFLEFHQKYYHPSNSYIYVYGDVNMDEFLEWMDSEYLSEYDRKDVDSEIGLQPAFERVRQIREEYSIAEDEDEKDNTYLSYNFVTGDILDETLYLAFNILEYAIASMPGAPLRKALIDAGIGKDVSGHFNNYTRQTYFNITAKNANECDKDRFEKIIMDTLKDLAENGIDRSSLVAALNNYEFQYRENDFGSYPKGLMFSFTVFDSWLYSKERPFRHLQQNEQFAFLRKMMDTDYYEKLIQKYFIDNNHASLVVLAPVKGLTLKKDTELKNKLADIKSKMSKEEIDELVKKTKHLANYQETPSTKEQLDTIPVLEREDLSKNVEPFINEEEEMSGIKVVKHNVFTNGIIYFNFMFDITDIPYELVSYLPLLRATIGYMDTENYTYGEISNLTGTYTGGIGLRLNQYSDSEDVSKYYLKLGVGGKVFSDKLGKALELIKEIIFRTKLEDEKRLYEIIAEGVTTSQSHFMRAGDSAAVTRNFSYLSSEGKIIDAIKGIESYRFIENAEKNFENEKGIIIDNLKKLIKHVFRSDNLIVSLTCQDNDVHYMRENIGDFVKLLKENNDCKIDVSKYPDNRTPAVLNEGFKTSAQVQYVTRVGNFMNKGYEYDGALGVLKTILTSEYLWHNIREKGGAYGCNCGFSRTGKVYFTSYRDPNLSKTNDVFMGVEKYIEEFDCDERDMTKYVIGTISGMDTPLTASAKGNRSMDAYIMHDRIENRQKIRKQVLEADQAKIRSFGKMIGDVLSDYYICVLGNEGKIEQDRELFSKVENLFQ